MTTCPRFFCFDEIINFFSSHFETKLKQPKKKSFFPFSKMSELWIQCFTCCVTERPQGVSVFGLFLITMSLIILVPTLQRRRRIDRSMIGQPTNFRHTGHIGSDDMADQVSTVVVVFRPSALLKSPHLITNLMRARSVFR